MLKRETLSVGQAIRSAVQPFQLFSYSDIGNAAIAGVALQLWHLSGSSSSAVTAQLHQQRSRLQQQRLRQPCSPNPRPCSPAAMQPCSHAALQPCSHAVVQPCSPHEQPFSLAALTNSPSALQPCSPNQQLFSFAALQPCSPNQQLRNCAALQPPSIALQVLLTALHICSLAAVVSSPAVQSTALQPKNTNHSLNSSHSAK